MTTEELHLILDNPRKKVTVKELKQIVYELKMDCVGELACGEHMASFYTGEVNAFQIVLDLLDHLV